MADMTEQEMLMYAAKALGLEVVKYDEASGFLLVKDSSGDVDWVSFLKDDGDCARMEAELGIDVNWNELYVRVVSRGYLRGLCFAKIEYLFERGEDKSKARRYASTRVAAEMGKRMMEEGK